MPYRSVAAVVAAAVAPRRARAAMLSWRPAIRSWRPALPSWRAAAICAVVTLAALLAVAGPGSLQELRTVPTSGIDSLPGWTRPCVIDTPPAGAGGRLAFCARLHGRVLAALPAFTSGDGQRHVVVTGGFHITLVELGPSMPTPLPGSTIEAVGPLQRAGAGLREMIALSLHG